MRTVWTERAFLQSQYFFWKRVVFWAYVWDIFKKVGHFFEHGVKARKCNFLLRNSFYSFLLHTSFWECSYFTHITGHQDRSLWIYCSHTFETSPSLKFQVASDSFEEGRRLQDGSLFWLKTRIKERWPFVIMDSSSTPSEINRRLCRLSHIHLLSQINPPTILSSPQQDCRGLLG